MFLRLAWRNLWRNRTRTIVMVSAVAFTYALGLVGMGMGDDAHERMLKEAIVGAGGDVIVHGKGYWETRSSDAVIRDPDATMREIANVEGVSAVIPRVIVNGLVSTSAGARPVLLQGVVPERERALRDIAEDLTEGSFLDGERSDPLVLGSRIVDKLDMELGDRVVLTASQPDGELTRALFHLSGVIETGTRELDEILGYTTIEAARKAVAMDGMLTQIGVLASGEDGLALAAAIDSAINADGNGLEVLPWQEAVPEMVGFIETDDAFGYIYMMVILLVVLFSITNTFLMAVMERVREFGLLAALGLKGNRIGRLLLTETVLLTALALVGGFALGFGGHLAIHHWGIPVSIWGIDEMEISGIDFADLVIYSTVNPFKWFVATVAVAAATVASALYPAWKATRLAPAEAMRFYE
jgi:putative ABC transport system permease protein